MRNIESRSIRAGRWLILAASGLLVIVGAPTAGSDWRGFRGLEQQGVGEATVSPTSWSATENVRWKAAIRGAGHSSPIVAGSHVYVTTAFESDRTAGVQQAARRLRLALTLAALVLWLLLPPAVARWQEVASAGLFAAFVMMALADERLFRIARSPARAWLAAGMVGVAGLTLSSYALGRSATTRRAIGILLGLFAVWLVAQRPTGIDGSLLLRSSLIALTAIACLSAVLVVRGIFAPLPCHPRAVRIATAAAVGLGSAVLLPTIGWPAVLAAVAAVAVGLVARAFFGLRPGVMPVWRAAVMAAAVLGVLVPTVLLPRGGWAHAVACIDRATGQVLWIREGLWASRTDVHRANSRATPTAVTDGAGVFAYFGRPGAMAVEANGVLRWTNPRVPFQSPYGVGSSPVLTADTLLVSGFTPESPYLVALDTGTGREKWRVARARVHAEFGDSRTPLVMNINGNPTLIVWGIDDLVGYDVANGQALWRYAHGVNQRMGSMVASIVGRGDRLYLPLENGMTALSVSRLAEGGAPVVWTSTGGGSALATPVLYDDRIYAVSAVGIASCTDAKTGTLLWRHRLEGEYHASPIAAAGKVYFTNESGKTTVVAATTFEVIAENNLGEPVSATIAPVDGDLYIRSHRHVYRVGS